MPYLPAKDELVSFLQFTFWRFSRKWKFFGNFDCDFSDWKWSISKFQFWRRIHDIYRQQLLTERETIQANNFDRVKDFLCWTIWMGSIAHLPRKKTSRTLIKVRFTLHLAVRELRELKQQRFWATDVNRKWTFCIIGQWFGWNSRVNRL